MLLYRAERPFAYRVLVPLVVNKISEAIPESEKQKLTGELNRGAHFETRYFRGDGKVRWTVDFSFAYYLIYYLDFASLFLALVFLRAILVGLPGNSPIAATFVPLAACVVLPVSFLHGGYFYDFPELLFLTLGFLLAFRGPVFPLIVLLPIATANKETAVLLPTLVLPILWLRFGAKKAKLVWLSGTALAGCTLLLVRATVESSKGTPMEFHLVDHLIFWLNPSTYIPFTSIIAPGIPFPKPQNILCVVALTGILWTGWRFLSVLERRLVALSAALNIPLVLLFAEPGEFRDLFLMFVPFAIASSRFFSETLDESSSREPSKANL